MKHVAETATIFSECRQGQSKNMDEPDLSVHGMNMTNSPQV